LHVQIYIQILFKLYYMCLFQTQIWQSKYISLFVWWC